MTEYFHIKGNRKDLKKLREYLKSLSENPNSGVSYFNIENEGLKKIQEAEIEENFKEYEKRRIFNNANANDVVLYPKDDSQK